METLRLYIILGLCAVFGIYIIIYVGYWCRQSEIHDNFHSQIKESGLKEIYLQTPEDLFYNTNIQMSFGHLRLPIERTLFYSSVRRLGMNEPWISRMRRIQQVCSSHRALHENSLPSGDRFMFSKKSYFVFCNAPKTGCTFMVSLYGLLELGMTPKQAFGYDRDAMHYTTYKYLSSDFPNSEDNFTKIIIARDPYQRLFSAYIDKVYLFGFTWASSEVASQSGKQIFMVDGMQCGYNTSFQDFLELYLNKALKHKYFDSHWRPVYDMCKVCNIDYQLVLKTETLSKDVEFIVDYLQIDGKMKATLRNTLRDRRTRENIIRALVNSYLNYQTLTKNYCDHITAYLFKLWQAFKSLGHIDNTVVFPWKRFRELKTITTNSVSEIIFEAMAHTPLSQSEKIEQRQDALVDAYRQVKQTTLDKIKYLYRYDFLLFGYDQNPPAN